MAMIKLKPKVEDVTDIQKTTFWITLTLSLSFTLYYLLNQFNP